MKWTKTTFISMRYLKDSHKYTLMSYLFDAYTCSL